MVHLDIAEELVVFRFASRELGIPRLDRAVFGCVELEAVAVQVIAFGDIPARDEGRGVGDVDREPEGIVGRQQFVVTQTQAPTQTGQILERVLRRCGRRGRRRQFESDLAGQRRIADALVRAALRYDSQRQVFHCDAVAVDRNRRLNIAAIDFDVAEKFVVLDLAGREKRRAERHTLGVAGDLDPVAVHVITVGDRPVEPQRVGVDRGARQRKGLFGGQQFVLIAKQAGPGRCGRQGGEHER